jgi:hypothetical protein
MDMNYAKAYMKERQDEANNRRLRKTLKQDRADGFPSTLRLLLTTVTQRISTRSTETTAGTAINTPHSCTS